METKNWMKRQHANGVAIVNGDFNSDDVVARGLTEERADMILRACNAHDELVKALQAARNGIVWYMENTDQANECDHEALQQIDAAIAKAGVA